MITIITALFKKYASYIKLIMIGAAVLFIFCLAISRQREHNKRVKLQDELYYASKNVQELLKQNNQYMTLTLAREEITGKIKRERDSLAKLLAIKPKQIEKIVTVTTVVHDTVDHLIPVDVIGKNQWSIIDTGQCFIWKGIATLKEDNLTVERTDYSSDNKVTEVFYWYRPHKFLGIKYGKKKYNQEVSSKCGKSYVQEINIKKK